MQVFNGRYQRLVAITDSGYGMDIAWGLDGSGERFKSHMLNSYFLIRIIETMIIRAENQICALVLGLRNAAMLPFLHGFVLSISVFRRCSGLVNHSFILI